MQIITYLKEPIYFRAESAVGGKEEHDGPLGGYFDFTSDDDLFGMESFERAEGEMSRLSMNIALKRCGMSHEELDLICAGDLQNQCVASSSGLFSFGRPFIGLYGACSTLGESLIVSSAMMSGCDKYKNTAVVTSSHNSAAERQFRTPLEYGGQRPPTAQWTATASGAFILSRDVSSAGIMAYMPGTIIDSYSTDPTNMGGAMALAAFDSLSSFFENSKDEPEDYDLILSGDLGKVGSAILHDLLRDKLGMLGLKIIARHKDAGMLLYNISDADVHSGGSGCGCSASVLASYILPMVRRGEIRRMLLMCTGALMSSSSVFQKEHIFGIAPIVKIEHFDKNGSFCK